MLESERVTVDGEGCSRILNRRVPPPAYTNAPLFGVTCDHTSARMRLAAIERGYGIAQCGVNKQDRPVITLVMRSNSHVTFSCILAPISCAP